MRQNLTQSAREAFLLHDGVLGPLSLLVTLLTTPPLLPQHSASITTLILCEIYLGLCLSTPTRPCASRRQGTISCPLA